MAQSLQLVSFYLEERLYGLDIRIVKEINPTVTITPVPRTEPHVRGLVNIRGQVVLVMDIAVIFGRSPRPVTADSQVVILKTIQELRNVRGLAADFDLTAFGDKPIGFLVDRIADVTEVPGGQIEPAPPHLTETNAKSFAGVVRMGDQLQIILDAGEMLQGDSTGARG